MSIPTLLRRAALCALAVAAFQPLHAEGPLRAEARQTCDRACLEGWVDRYLDALIAHDPGRLPLALDVRLTENGQQLEVGDGLWRSMVGRGTYRFFVSDVGAGQVAFIGTIREESNSSEDGRPSALALRLKIDDGRISEIETFVVTSETAAENLEGRGGAPAVLLEVVPPPDRMSRSELIRVANDYYTGLQQNDGRGDYPVADDCNRFENGRPATNRATPEGETRPDPATARTFSSQWSCSEQLESGLFHFVTRIRDRRFVAVDEERGLVFDFAFFDHSGGDTRTFETPDGRTVTAGPVDPWTWEIADVFKIQEGLVQQVDSLLERVPYGMNSGWSSWEAGMSDRPQDVTGSSRN